MPSVAFLLVCLNVGSSLLLYYFPGRGVPTTRGARTNARRFTVYACVLAAAAFRTGKEENKRKREQYARQNSVRGGGAARVKNVAHNEQRTITASAAVLAAWQSGEGA